MSDLPTGTVAFLCTDIEGSTHRWETYPEAMKLALRVHDGLIRSAIQDHGGRVFKTVGDGFLAVFSRTVDAADAAIAGQRALAAQSWGETGPIRVRMAVHVGTADEREGDYFGPAVNRAARLLSAAHGGQILLSRVARELLPDVLPEGVTLEDLGEHRLKDLVRPEHVYQIAASGLPLEFPPLRTLEIHRHNLPTQTTTFIGREGQMAEGLGLLADSPLVTLTGPGGTGKTRLLLQMAAEAVDRFADGVWLVELDVLQEGALVAPAVARVLGVREESSRSVTDSLVEHLRDRSALLLLDNCEHVVDSAAQVARALVAACPGSRILTSSREPLGIDGERLIAVPPLGLPSQIARPEQSESVRLFVDRAALASPGFRLGGDDVAAVAELCRRLDGIPLAIELAASHARLLAPRQMLERLTDNVRALRRRGRGSTARHDTLDAAVQWSHELLSDSQRTLYRRLSVFWGSWSLEAAESICSGEGDDVVSLVGDLADKSLVVVEESMPGPNRYRMLEVVRAHALARLSDSGEGAHCRSRHLGFYLEFSEETELQIKGSDQEGWLRRCDAELPNLRAALDWSEQDGAHRIAWLRLSASLWRYWVMRGMLAEGWDRLHRAADAARTGAAPVHARVLVGAGAIAFRRGEHDVARLLLERGLEISRAAGDGAAAALALENLGVLLKSTDASGAMELLAEALELYRAAGDAVSVAHCLRYAGHVEEALTAFRSLGNNLGVAQCLVSMGFGAVGNADYVAAERLCAESLRLFREVHFQIGIARSLLALGMAARERGECVLALSLLCESRNLSKDIGESDRVEGLDRQIAETWRRLRHQGSDSAGDQAAAGTEAQHPCEDPIAFTRTYYDTHAERIATGTQEVDKRSLYDPFLAAVGQGRALLDAGCGSGRDAAWFLEHGYDVTAFDGSRGMAEVASRRLGRQVAHLSCLELRLEAQFDGIWADESLLHVPRHEIDAAVDGLVRALKPGGVLYMSFRKGTGERLRGEVFFNDYDEETLRALLARHEALSVIQIWAGADPPPRREGVTWVRALARKRS